MESTQQRNLFYLIIVSLLLTSSSPAAGLMIRLSGSTRCSGRIEISHNGSWVKLCGDSFDLNDAQVVCRQWNCGTAVGAPKSTQVGKGIWLNDLACSGSEWSLTRCQHKGFWEGKCKEAGVVCSGSLPKPSISMGPVTWGQDVVITCLISHQIQRSSVRTFILNQWPGSFRQRKASYYNRATFRIFKVDFDKEGSYQCQYQISVLSQVFISPLSDSVTLSIAVRLQQPSISLTSPNRALVWGPEDAEVTWGHSFVFTCSTNSIYSEGRFCLIFSGSNITVTEPAVNQSASFNFPAAEYKHQGNYSCVYEVTLSSRKFTSTETAPISVTVKLPLVLLVSSIPCGILLLLLLISVVVCLVLRRRHRAKQPGVQTQLTIRNNHEDDDEEDRDYVNVEPTDTNRKETEQAGAVKDEDSDRDDEEMENDYVNIEDNREEEFDEEETSDDENDYVNVTQSFTDQSVDIYG